MVMFVEFEGDGVIEKVCIVDFVLCVSIGVFLEGVDLMKDIEFCIMYGDMMDDVDFDGDLDVFGILGMFIEYLFFVGWFDDSGFVLLIWGLLICFLVVELVEGFGDVGMVIFVIDGNQVCIMDMVFCVIIFVFGDDMVDDDKIFILMLVGGGFDGMVEVC